MTPSPTAKPSSINTSPGLNARQRLFVAEYLVDKSGTNAAMPADGCAAA